MQMEHKTLFPVLEMGFLFRISYLQFALIADLARNQPPGFDQIWDRFRAYH